MRLPRFARNNGEAAADRFEHRPHLYKRVVFTGSDDPELACLGDCWPAEDRRTDVALVALPVCSGDAPREGYADGRKRDVDGSGRKCLQKSSLFRVTKEDGLRSRIVRSAW